MVSHLIYLALLIASATLFLSNNVDATVHSDYASPPPPHNYYNFPPPPPHDYYNSPPTGYYTLPILKVVGKVCCHNCLNWKFPATYCRPLEGARVKVICKEGNKEHVEYAETAFNGEYIVTIEGYLFHEYGAEGCHIHIHSAPKGSLCNIPMELNKGAQLKVISESHEKVVLEAKSIAFAPETEKRKENHHYKKPPPPSPSYYYKSPPPPTYLYSSPPPPPYYY